MEDHSQCQFHASEGLLLLAWSPPLSFSIYVSLMFSFICNQNNSVDSQRTLDIRSISNCFTSSFFFAFMVLQYMCGLQFPPQEGLHTISQSGSRERFDTSALRSSLDSKTP